MNGSKMMIAMVATPSCQVEMSRRKNTVAAEVTATAAHASQVQSSPNRKSTHVAGQTGALYVSLVPTDAIEG
jgi:hypothetical protein